MAINDKPVPIRGAVHRYVSLAVTVIVCRYVHISLKPPDLDGYVAVAAIDDEPVSVGRSVDGQISAPIMIKIKFRFVRRMETGSLSIAQPVRSRFASGRSARMCPWQPTMTEMERLTSRSFVRRTETGSSLTARTVRSGSSSGHFPATSLSRRHMLDDCKNRKHHSCRRYSVSLYPADTIDTSGIRKRPKGE